MALHARHRARTLYIYPAEALTDIFIGPDAAFACLEILALIVMNQNPEAQLWQGRRSKSDFSVVFEQVTYTPQLEAKRQGLPPDDAQKRCAETPTVQLTFSPPVAQQAERPLGGSQRELHQFGRMTATAASPTHTLT